jgi:hypothetical protein
MTHTKITFTVQVPEPNISGCTKHSRETIKYCNTLSKSCLSKNRYNERKKNVGSKSCLSKNRYNERKKNVGVALQLDNKFDTKLSMICHNQP